MRLFKHMSKEVGGKPTLFLAQRVEDTAGGLGYSGFMLEAQQLGSGDGAAYVLEGRLKHHGLAMPEDLQELSGEDLVDLLPGVAPAEGAPKKAAKKKTSKKATKKKVTKKAGEK